MLFRGPHDSGDVGAIGPRTDSEHSCDEDETCSTSGRSYTSAESATAQSFELRMAQLDSSPASGSGSKLLSPGYQLFATGDSRRYGSGSGIGANSNDAPHSLSLVNGLGESEAGASGFTAPTRATDFDDEDERDADYLTALLSDIERHAARLDTQFHRYPSAESLKQQMAAQQEAAGKKSTPAKSGGKGGDSGKGNAAAASEGSGATATAATASGGSGSAHSTGTKLFLGGLRYEVIQSGRHTVSWIFQTACGVHINPSSILIHRKTKNGRSNVAPTGCASVFVADDADVAALLEMNQRIYCAEEGVYVSPSPETMKELIASKDIVDVTGGRVRGPTHPVVIERAYSVSHHHGHHGGANNAAGNRGQASTTSNVTTTTTATNTNITTANASATTTTSAAGGNVNASASGGAHGGAGRHGRSPSSISAESNLSNQLMGGMPPPYAGALPPQYTSSATGSITGSIHPPSYTPSSVSSSSLGAPAMNVPMVNISSPNGFAPNPLLLSRTSTPSLPKTHDDGRGSNAGGQSKLDPQRVTFHPYLHSGRMEREQNAARPDFSTAAAAHTVLFLAALPSDATEDYVSWLFSLMSITLPATRIHIIGGSASASAASDCCATVSVSEGDVSIALNFHHRVLCTSRGAWIGHSAQDIAALRASDVSLRDAAVLHVDRRMSAQGMGRGGGGSSSSATAGMNAGPVGSNLHGAGGAVPPGFPYSMTMTGAGSGVGVHGPPGVAGAGGPSMPPPPSSYPHLFGAMPLPGAQGGMMPMAAAPWGFASPSPHPGMGGEGGSGYPPMPHPPANLMGGGGAGGGGAAAAGGLPAGLPPGAIPITSLMPMGGGGYSMPPPPPPFSYTPSVTIGDRTYQLPPGATVQYLPVVSATQGVGGGGEASATSIKVGGTAVSAERAKSASSKASTGGNESPDASTRQQASTPPQSASSK